MKLTLLSLLAVLVLVAGCQKSRIDPPTSQISTVTISLPSIVCESCSRNIRKAVQSVDGVEEIKVSVERKSADVTFVRARTNVEAIENAISRAGYDANKRKRDPEAYERLDACCKIDG
jgi:copper chaperone CopZ